jgi:WW domain-containing oxidoreductase
MPYAVQEWVDLRLLKARSVPELLGNARINVSKRFRRPKSPVTAQLDDLLSESLAGKLCIVTGAESGVGLETSAALARRGATVLMACLSLERGEAAVRHVRASLDRLKTQNSLNGDSDDESDGAGRGGSANGHKHPGTVEARQLDLARLSNVREFVRRCPRRPDLLICNAGIMAPEQRGETPDGLEQQFQVGQGVRMACYFVSTVVRGLCNNDFRALAWAPAGPQ